MAVVKYDGGVYEITPDTSVLDVLLDGGVEIPFGCKSGVCHACMMQVVDGDVPAAATQGLRDTHKQKGYFLACQCVPEVDLEIANADQVLAKYAYNAVEYCRMGGDILRLRLTPEDNQHSIQYRSGQYINLWLNGECRSFSVASVPELETFVELHIQLRSDGHITGNLESFLSSNQPVVIQGAMGDCFYLPEMGSSPLVLAGLGTGLAPLYGIVRDALNQQHSKPIYLFAGARDQESLYLHDALLELSGRHDNLHYYPSVLEAEDGMESRSIYDLIRETLPSTADFKAFVCGNESAVKKLRKQIFLSGASMKDIFADPFVSPID